MASGQKVCPKCGTRYERLALFCQRDGEALGDPDAPPDPYIGKVLLDQFQIQAAVGQGGMGTVYRARQTTIGRDVAIKILHPELARNPDAVRRFQREAKVSSALDHPNVVRVFLFGQLPDGSLYIVMQFLEGRSLLELLREERTLDPSRALHIATQICDGVGEAHAQGVIHRDVKPENVLLVHRGHDPDFVKVLDFGIARFISQDQTVATQSGLIFGTARYISPEGAAGEPTDARSDVYSIGVLLYQMLAGVTPFDSSSPVALLMKHINEEAPDLRGLPASRKLPPEVCDVVMRTLAKNADARFDDANQLASALREAAHADGVVVAGPRVSVLPSSVAPVPLPPRGEATPSTGPMHGRKRRERGEDIEGSIPGLRRPRLGAGATLALSFVLGAAAVSGGAALVTTVLSATTNKTDDVDDLTRRARAALARGDIDEPSGENVLELTDRLLSMDPESRSALRIRDEAVVDLRTAAEIAHARDDIAGARNAYRRALVLVPDDGLSRRGLAALDAASAAPVERRSSLSVIPATPTANEPVVVEIELADALPANADVRLVVERIGVRGARQLTATPEDDGRVIHAAYAFPRAGDYRLTFASGETVIDRLVTVTGPAIASHRHEPPVTTQHGSEGRTQMEEVSDGEGGEDGIDWALPDEVRPDQRQPPPPTMNEPPPTMNEPLPEPPPVAPPPPPPAPWTSGAI